MSMYPAFVRRLAPVLVVVFGLLVACGRTEPSGSTALAPSASTSTAPLVTTPPGSASARSQREGSAIIGFPPLDATCEKDADCGTAFHGDDCCNQCQPRIGSKAWSAKVTAFCTSRDANQLKGCTPIACSWAFAPPVCRSKQCVEK